MATVDVARRTFEDGSTVTLVRNVSNDGVPHLRASMLGGPASLAEGWRFAGGYPGDSGHVSRSAGLIVQASDRSPYAVELAGQRVMLHRIDPVVSYPDNGQTVPAFAGDTLLLGPGGAVAAYVPGSAIVGPSDVGWDGYVSDNGLPDIAPPFAFKGKLKQQWDQGLDGRLDRLGLGGVFLPTSASVERAVP